MFIMPEQDRVKKFRISYTKSNEYKTIYADGALVGQAAGNAVVMDFYIGNFIPSSEYYVWSESGKNYETKLETPDVQSYERVRQIEVAMTLENAEILANAILEKIQATKEQNK